MEKKFVLSDEWRILRNAVSVYYKRIERDISSVIYSDIKKTYERIYNEEQIQLIQRDKTANAVSIVNKSIFKKFFNITNLENSFRSPKWQNKLSCEELTRLILLLQKSTEIVKIDRGDYTFIEAKINKITNEEFLSSSRIDNDRGFERSRSLSKEKIENKDNFKNIFKKYLELIYDSYREENYCSPLNEYLKDVIEFTDNNSFLKSKHKKSDKLDEYFEEISEEIGNDYDGKTVIKRKMPNGEEKYFVDGEEISLFEIEFNKEDESKILDVEKFIRNNNKNFLKNSENEDVIDKYQEKNTLKEKNIDCDCKDDYIQLELL